MNELDEATEHVLYDAEHQCDGDQLKFVRAICQASIAVNSAPAKIASRVLAIAALGGEREMSNLLRLMLVWVESSKR